MAVTQLNNYLPGQNLTNLAENTDYNRVGEDLTSISVNFSTSVVSIEVGSLVEANGNLYTVDTADYTIASATGIQYIHFDGTLFTLSTDRGVHDAEKGGYYDTATSGKRVLKWVVDSDNEFYCPIIDIDSYQPEWNDDALGLEIVTITQSVNDTYYSDPFIIKKPISVRYVIDNISGVILGIYQRVNDSTWIQIDQSMGNLAFLLNPGIYRLELVLSAAASRTVSINLLGFFGHTDWDTADGKVFEVI